eukprot:203806_1
MSSNCQYFLQCLQVYGYVIELSIFFAVFASIRVCHRTVNISNITNHHDGISNRWKYVVYPIHVAMALDTNMCAVNSGDIQNYYSNTDCSGDITSSYNITSTTFTNIEPVDCTQSNLPLCDYTKCDDTAKLRSSEHEFIATNECYYVPNSNYNWKYMCDESGIFGCYCDTQTNACNNNTDVQYSFTSNTETNRYMPYTCDSDTGKGGGLYCNGVEYDVITPVEDAPTMDGSLYTPTPTTVDEKECEHYGLVKYMSSSGHMLPELWHVIDVCVPQIQLANAWVEKFSSVQYVRTEESWIKYCENNTLYQRWYHGSNCEGDSYFLRSDTGKVVNTYYHQVNCSEDFDYKSICPLREYGIVEQYYTCHDDSDFSDMESNAFTILLNQCTIDKTGCNVKFVCDDNGNGIHRIGYAPDDDTCEGDIVNSKLEYTHYVCNNTLAQAVYCNGQWNGEMYSVYYNQQVPTNAPSNSRTTDTQILTPTKTPFLNTSSVCKLWCTMHA